MPTFTNLLQTIAPPISAHERLQIHTTHDMLSYPSLDPLIYTVFARVMSQVEGGDLVIIQRGSESRARPSSEGYRGSALGIASTGWTDGPWWREAGRKRDLGVVKGLAEGTKLARANAEACADDFFAARGGVEEAAKQATRVLSESNPVRSSDIFLAIQALSRDSRGDLFAGSAAGEGEKTRKEEGAGAGAGAGVVGPETRDEDEDEEVLFAVYLHDPIHGINFKTVSQPFPKKWVGWMDESGGQGEGEEEELPESIREIVESGGVDPREWVAEWMEEVLSLAVGVVAQRYVARRMGVGEGGIGRGKGRVRAEEGVAGEAARAI